ncbi:MAG TPA: sigma-70 family RNA polymerase sigma factor [Gemmataceae bacterium]|jgi:RNA polymerase sigma factor (sigma-70 family)
MAGSQAERVLKHLHHLIESSGAQTDGRLLERFVARRDEDAFAELVARHGPLVYGVCRRILRDSHDAEDVFQAAFLVLARKAPAIRKPESLPSFLHNVAYRLAIKARTAAERRRQHERRAVLPRQFEETDLSWRDVRGLIDEELSCLPEKWRLPLVLCFLEGQTQGEAARCLGWSRGTLKRRLERGRDRLRLRLTRRGVTLGAGLLTAALTEGVGKAAVPIDLRVAAVRGGIRFTTGAVVGSRAALLAEGMLQTMRTTKIKFAVVLALVLGGAAAAAGLASRPAPPINPQQNKAETRGESARKITDARPASARESRKDRQGDPLPEGATARLGTLRMRHTEMTASAVFTRDGKTAIVGDGAGNLVYWDVATGREVRRLRGAPGVVHALAISSDGKILASGSWGGVIFWDTVSGKLLATATVKDDLIVQIRFTPDGKTLALRGQGSTIYLWDRISNKQLYALKGHTGNVSSLDISPDGKTLASGSWKDGHIRLWDIETGKENRRIDAFSQDVVNVAFSPDGKAIASTGNVGGLRLWDAATGKKLAEPPRGNQPMNLAYAPDGKTFAGMEGDGRLHVYNAANGKHLRAFDAPGRTMAGLTYAPDGKTIATFWGGAHTFDLWDVAGGKLLHPDVGHRHCITSLAFTADGKTLFSAAGITDSALYVWNGRTGEILGRLGDNPNSVNGLALSPDGKVLAACGYNDNTIRLWDVATRKEIRSLKGHTSVIVSVVWSADGKTLVSGSYYDKSIRVWDSATGKQRRAIEYKSDWPCDVVLSPDGTLLAGGGYQDGSIVLWSAETGAEVRRIATPQGMVTTLAFSPDGTMLASGGSTGGIRLWDPNTGRPLRQWEVPPGWIGSLVFTPDGRSLLTGQHDATVRLWEVLTGRERGRLTGHRGGVRALTVSRDGRSIASGSEDTTVLLWDAASGVRPNAELSAKELQNLWSDLIGQDAVRANRAVWQLALSPRHALPWLAERLRPIAPLDAERGKQVDRLLADLDHESFKVRQNAEAELEKMGTSVEPALRKALEGKPSLEVRRRIEKVLEKVAGWSGDRLRAARALEAIEHMNTPEARCLLEQLANGAARAWLTREAKAARQRFAP